MWFRRDLGFNVVAFDYRGYGFSDGKPGARAIRDDTLQIYDDVVTRFEPSGGLIINGWSLGTQFAVHVAAQRPVRGLILQAPPASAAQEAAWYSAHALPFPLRGLLRLVPNDEACEVFQGASEIRRVRCPLLVIHGTADGTIPIEQGREVYEAAASPQKAFIAIPGANHNELPFTAGLSGAAVERFVRELP